MTGLWRHFSRHLGEGADGRWSLRIADVDPTGSGTLNSWRLVFYGVE